MTIKEKADELVEEYTILLSKSYQYPKKRICLNLAIKSVEHTIEVLYSVFENQDGTTDIYIVAGHIMKQIELLTELKSRR